MIRVAYVGEVVCQPVGTFGGFFTVLPLCRVVVSSAVGSEAIRVFHVRRFSVDLRTFFVTSVPNVGSGDHLFVPNVIVRVVRPIYVIFHVGCLYVDGVGVPIKTIFAGPSAMESRARVVAKLFLFCFVVVAIGYFVPQEDNGRGGAFALVAKWDGAAINDHFGRVRTVKCFSTHRQFFALIGCTVLIFVCVCVTHMDDRRQRYNRRRTQWWGNLFRRCLFLSALVLVGFRFQGSGAVV